MTKEMWGNPDRTFPIQKLLQSFQDAIKWIHQLGIRYLWVDKLCIDWVAGDGDIDSVEETANLAEYCKRAALVINAGDHEDANGIFTRRETNLLELTCEFHDGKTAVLCFRPPLPSAEQCFSDQILSRSWIFQEIALPRRVIIFGKDQVYWKCRQVVRSEGDVLASRPPLDFSAVSSTLEPSADGKTLFDKWYKMVSLFSSKKISFFNDRLPAIKGMAIVHESNLRSRGLLAGHKMPYRSGLWEPDLHRGLLWYAADVRNARRPQTTVPSWSWASVEGTISYSFLPGLLAPSGAGSATEITVRDASSMIDSLEPAPGADAPPRARINAFIPVLVNAPWAYIDPTSQDGSCQILFDTGDDEDRWYEGGSGYDFVVVVIAKWSPERSETSFRWIGLLLEIVGSFGSTTGRPCLDSFRVGLVLGPWSHVGVETWNRGDFALANGWFDHAANVIEVDEERDIDHAAMMHT